MPIADNSLILIVDDDRDSADLLAEAIGIMGYHSMVAYSGADALRLAQENLPVVAIIDLVMPGMDGYTVAAELRNSGPTASIGLIALTASVDAISKELALVSGFNRFIVKPAALGAVAQAIGEHLAYGSVL